MELQLDTIINSLDDVIVSVNESQRVVFLNEAAARMFGAERSRLLGLPVAQFPALADVWAQLRLDELHLSSASPKAVRRLHGKRSDGESFPLEALVSCTTVNGRDFFTAVMRDISVQEQMENAVFQARKHQAVGGLASGIAHDFNNILTAIISQLDLAIFAPECPAPLKANLNYAQASARRGAELVNKLQMFSRQTQPKFTPVNLSETLAQVVFVLQRSIDPRVEVKYVTPSVKPWLVKADTGQMMQALVNLGLNARDAMPDGGKMTISLVNLKIAAAEARPPRRAGEFVKLTVGDTGHGMPPEVLARLFEPYFTTKEFGKGPGLGLSITFSVVAEHGGWMEAESRVGRGTEFHVYLPRTSESEAAKAGREIMTADSKALDGRERILIADDEEQVRMVIRAVLAYRGYQVVEAADGEEAVRLYKEAAQPFDLVLMDLHMPHMNGRDALMRIRQHNPKVKALLLSGGLHERETENPVGLERVRFFQKPFDNQELLTVVRQTLDAK